MLPAFANELERCLSGDSFAAAPSHILEALDATLADRVFPNVPRTIYDELWHITFWQQLSLDWVEGRPTPNPDSASGGFPTPEQKQREPWTQLCARFQHTSEQVSAIAGNPLRWETVVTCPSPAGQPTRTMTVREQMESLLGHNAYHFGRIVLLRQMAGDWPPPSGGFTW